MTCNIFLGTYGGDFKSHVTSILAVHLRDLVVNTYYEAESKDEGACKIRFRGLTFATSKLVQLVLDLDPNAPILEVI